MKKLKKIYCWASLAFGTFTLIFMLCLCFGQSAYATTNSAGDENSRLTEETAQELGQLSSTDTSQNRTRTRTTDADGLG